jgi:hypothetical protein
MPFVRPIAASDVMRLMVRQAWQFAALDTRRDWQEAVELWPSLALSPSVQEPEQVQVLDMLRRYSLEWTRLLQAHPPLQKALGWPEEDRS